MIGQVRKMRTSLNEEVEYQLPLGEDKLHMNELIGESIKLTFNGEILCTKCGRKTKKSFGEGFCYPCFRDAPEAAECIIHPEKCRGHLGEGRDPEWEKEHHVQPHMVYLALSSTVKVGITRETQIPTRWIDQGASAAVPLLKTENRYQAGVAEVFLKKHFTDKTNWRKMLMNDIAPVSELIDAHKYAIGLLDSSFEGERMQADIMEINYPVKEYPVKITSLNFDKHPEIDARLKGIKGQY